MQRPVLILLACAAIISAEPVGRTIGIGTRAYGMANNFTALSNDYSALFWNPAGMAFVPVREFHAAMDFNRQDNDAAYGGMETMSFIQRYRLSSLGLLRSVPTERGGFALGIGFSSPWLIDDVNNVSGYDVYRGSDTLYGYDDRAVIAGDRVVIDKSNHVSRGACNLWNMGAGWQIAPALGFGISVGLLSGSEVRKIELEKSVSAALFESVTATAERSFLSYDARIGLLYNPRRELSLGCRVELPRLLSMVAENYSEYDAVNGPLNLTSYGTLQSPFAGAIGVALQLPFITVTSDATVRSPLGGVAKSDDLSHWKEGVGVGVEVPAKWIAGIFRGGYSYSQFDPSAMRIQWEDPLKQDKVVVTGLHGTTLLTAGYSLFVGNSVSLDMAYGYSISEFSMKHPYWENYKHVRNTYQRGMVSLAVRY